MEILQKQISMFGEEKLTSLPEDSLVNHTHRQGNKREKADNRHLWPEMLRAIRQIQPSWIVGENVPGLLNWERGMVLDEIKTDLESAGFELLPPCILPACGKDAPHRRERLWIMAYCNTPTDTEIHRDRRNTGTMGETQAEPKSQDDGPEFNGSSKDVANADERRLQREAENRELGRERFMFSTSANKQQWENFPTQSPLCSRNDGLPTELAGITIPKHRTESIKGYGNAIVPQVAFEIFKAIEKTYEL